MDEEPTPELAAEAEALARKAGDRLHRLRTLIERYEGRERQARERAEGLRRALTPGHFFSPGQLEGLRALLGAEPGLAGLELREDEAWFRIEVGPHKIVAGYRCSHYDGYRWRRSLRVRGDGEAEGQALELAYQVRRAVRLLDLIERHRSVQADHGTNATC